MTTRSGTAPVVPDELLRHLDEREQDAHAEADRLRAEIAELSARLGDIQQVVSRLRLTRQTLLEITGQQDEQDRPGTADARLSSYCWRPMSASRATVPCTPPEGACSGVQAPRSSCCGHLPIRRWAATSFSYAVTRPRLRTS